MQIWVKRHYVDGVWLFTPDDREGTGLCASDADEYKAEQKARNQLLQILNDQGFSVINQNLIMRYLLPGQIKPLAG